MTISAFSRRFSSLLRASGARILWVAVPGVAFACSGSESSGFGGGLQVGAERGACRSDKTCDPGLICLSDVCVRMPDAGTSSKGGASNGNGGANGGRGGGAASGGASGGGAGGRTSSSGGNVASGGAQTSGGMNAGGASGGASGASTTGGTANDSGGVSTGGAPATGGTSGAGGVLATGGASATGGAGGGRNDGGPQCRGSHPNVQGQRRYCDVGSCYCTDPFDTCFTSNIADNCCNNTPICGNGQPDGGVNCAGVHPIIGPPRTCSSGYCYCSDGNTIDVCYPAGISDACCPPRIQPVCVP